MEVRVLGPIEVHDGHQLAIGGPRQRRILAALAMNAGEVVSLDRLVDITWSGDQPPENAERNVRTYVHRIRTGLGEELDERIATSPPGYLLRVEADELDLVRFEHLVSRADRVAAQGDAASSLAYVDEALSLWRGNPFEEFADEVWVEGAATRLADTRARALELRADALIGLERSQEAVAALESLIAEAPYRERPRELLMRAFYGDGRHAEALRVFQDFRALLVEELGIDPSESLVDLERRILDHDPGLSAGGQDRSLRSYELDQVIGEGAFAMVWQATQPELHREVAIKQIRDNLANDPDFIRRFEVEAQLVSTLEHPYIVPLYDYWREPDAAYLVMRLLRGGTLEERIATGPLDEAELTRLADQIGSALRAAHRRGVVHRDVKPANIMLDEDSNYYLTDFGIALGVEGEDDAAIALSTGSPFYAAPEQLRREDLDARTDIYSFGVTLFEATVGEHPFADETTRAALVQRQLSEDLPRPSLLRPGAPSWVDAIVRRATTKSPSDRYATVDDLLLELTPAAPQPAGPAAGSSSTIVTGPARNPFKGLRAFQESDAPDFRGRQRLVARFLEVLQRPGSPGRLLAAVGPSGSGKSSAVRAGLIPALRNGAIAGSDGWFVTTMMPGAHPFDELESALTRVAPAPPGPLGGLMSGHERGVSRAVKQVLPDESSELVLVIDQFEELFTLVDDESERTMFLDGLLQAIRDPRSRLRAVVTVRADFWDKPLGHPGLAPLLETAAVTVSPLAADELERAIVDPVTRQGMEYEPGLVARIGADVVDQPGALPLLQFALTELFDRNVSGLILGSAYDELGGMTGAIAKRAEDTYNTYSGPEQQAARRILGRLVTLGEGAEDTRRRVTLAELSSDDETVAVVDTLGQARLLAFDRDPVTRGPTVEIAHEALLRAWPRLRGWINDDRDDLRIHRHLTTAATEWDGNNRDDGELYRGGRLETAELWATTSSPALNSVESDFLKASATRRDAEELAERARLRRLRHLLMVTGVVAIVALVAGALALRQKSRADDQAALAEQNAELADTNADEAAASAADAAANAREAEASALLADQRAEEAEAARAEGDLERIRTLAGSIADESVTAAALLAVEAHNLDPSVQSLTALHEVMTAIPGYRGTIAGGPYSGSILLGDQLTLAAVGPEAIDVWDLSDRELRRSIPHINPVPTAVLDATMDGRIAVVRGEVEQTFIYDLTTGEALGSLQHPALVNDVSISADASKVAVALSNGEVQIWDLRTFALEKTLDTGDIEVFFARWNPVDGRLAVVTLASQVQYWDPPGDEVVWAEDAPAGTIVNENTPFAFIYSSDGERLAFVSGSLGAEIRVYNTVDGTLPVEPSSVEGGAGFVLDSMYWLDEAETVLGLPTSGNVLTHVLSSGVAPESQLDRFIGKANDVVFSPELDRFVIATAAGLEIWSSDGSGPLERVAPLTAAQLTALEGGGPVLPSLAADGSELLVSVFSLAALAPTTSFDLTAERLTPRIFDENGRVTIGYGSVTLAASFTGVQILDSDHVALGPPVPLPFDFTELSASADGSYFAFGRLGGFADLYTGTGEFVATVSLGDSSEYEGAQTGPSFSANGEYMAVVTTQGGFGVWTTDPLQRITIPNPGDWVSGRLMGEWLFISRTDGSFMRVDPATFEVIGLPVPSSRAIGYSKLDEINLRVASATISGDPVLKVWDLETAQQLGGDLPYQGQAGRYEFTADGSILSVPEPDRVTLWNYDTDTWADIACEVAGRNLTQDEWDQLGPRTIERRATCPQFPLD